MPATQRTASSGSFADRRRGTRQERGYGAAWERARDAVMRRDGGLCQPCMQRGLVTQASEVDHIFNKASGGTDEHDNLQAICSPCHQAKTAIEAAQARGVDAVARPSAACSKAGAPTDPGHPWNQAGRGVKNSKPPARRTEASPRVQSAGMDRGGYGG